MMELVEVLMIVIAVFLVAVVVWGVVFFVKKGKKNAKEDEAKIHECNLTRAQQWRLINECELLKNELIRLKYILKKMGKGSCLD